MRLAADMSDIETGERKRLSALLHAADLPTTAGGLTCEQLLEAMGHDKKVLAGQIRLILLRALGAAFVSSDYDRSRLVSVLEQVDG